MNEGEQVHMYATKHTRCACCSKFASFYGYSTRNYLHKIVHIFQLKFIMIP